MNIIEAIHDPQLFAPWFQAEEISGGTKAGKPRKGGGGAKTPPARVTLVGPLFCQPYSPFPLHPNSSKSTSNAPGAQNLPRKCKKSHG